MRDRWKIRKTFLRLPEWSRTFLLAGAIGISTGLAAILLRTLIDRFEQGIFFPLLGAGADYGDFPLRPWALLLLPAAGGLVAGGLVAWLAPEAAGGGSDAVVEGYHQHRLRSRWRLLPVKLLASSLAIGLGLAGGGEGPISQIGALLGERWASLFRATEKQQRQFFTAGVAAGIGAFFHAPLGGALFATEAYYRRPDLESSALLPSLIASSLAFTVYNLGEGWQALLPVPPQVDLGPRAVALVVGLALLCGWMSRWTLRLIKSFHHAFAKLPLALKPGLAGLCSGLLVLGVLLSSRSLTNASGHPALVLASLGEGYGILKLAANGIFPLWPLLLMMLALRIATTALAHGSESPVGAFAPAMVIGAATGLAAGLLGNLAGLPGSPVPMALAGMAAYFSASFRSPLAAVVMIAEVSQGYALLPVLMLAATLGYLTGPDPGWIPMQRLQRGSRR